MECLVREPIAGAEAARGAAAGPSVNGWSRTGAEPAAAAAAVSPKPTACKDSASTADAASPPGAALAGLLVLLIGGCWLSKDTGGSTGPVLAGSVSAGCGSSMRCFPFGLSAGRNGSVGPSVTSLSVGGSFIIVTVGSTEGTTEWFLAPAPSSAAAGSTEVPPLKLVSDGFGASSTVRKDSSVAFCSVGGRASVMLSALTPCATAFVHRGKPRSTGCHFLHDPIANPRVSI
mmetsp:Transcript_6369/g.18317  ORF Transcript_6369/g.18317 Transcript_6369/m.18317 type:complete len:231 (-) Transcript_6369:36-728(-)